jgi:hypothetical protein
VTLTPLTCHKAWVSEWGGGDPNWGQRADHHECMKKLTEFHEANHKLMTACQMLIEEGFTDIESYESFVHIYMSPWFDQMRQVALRLAGRGATLTVPHGVGAVALLKGMGVTAHRQLNEAVSAGDAQAAARAAIFGCGVQLALNALEAEAGYF